MPNLLMTDLLNKLEYSAYALLDYSLDGSRDALIFEDDIINSCMTMSNEIEENRKKTDAGVISGSLASVVGGGLSVGGLLLMPFTFGVSAGLIGVGATLGVTGSAVSTGFELHKFVRDRQISKALHTCEAKFVTIRKKLAKIAIATSRVLVNVEVLRTSQMWGEVQRQDPTIRSSVDTLTQLWEGIRGEYTASNPETAINSVLVKATEGLRAFEDIIEGSNITDVQLHPRITKDFTLGNIFEAFNITDVQLHPRITEDIEPSPENLDSALKNLCKSGFQEGMNIGKLLLAFFTEQFDDFYNGANLEEIRNTAYPTIASAVNGSSGAVIRPIIDINHVNEIIRRVHVNGRMGLSSIEISDDVASAGASVTATTALNVSRGIPREDLSKQFYELAVIMALTNTIVSSRGN